MPVSGKAANHILILLAMHLVARTQVNADRKAVYNHPRESHECRVVLAMGLHAMIYIASSCIRVGS